MKKRYILSLVCIVVLVIGGCIKIANAEDEVDVINREDANIIDEISESSVPMPDEDIIVSDTNADIVQDVDQEANNEAGVIGIENPDEQSVLSAEAEKLIDEDENLDAGDLGINDPTILPDSTILYPLKNVWRGVLSIVTTDPVKKAQLKLRFANEKLMEAKKISEKTDDSAMIEKAIDNYKNELEQVQLKVALIKEKAEDNEAVDKLVDQMTDNQIKHTVIFDRIEKNFSEEALEKFSAKIEIARNNIEGNLSKAILTVAEVEKYGEKLEEAMDNQNGSDFKHFKNLEVLKRIEGNIPEEAKEAIQKAQANVQVKFEKQFTDLPEKNQQVFQYYVQNIGGNEIRQFEVISDLENEVIPDTMREIVEEAKGQNVIRIEKRLQNPEFMEKSQQIIKHLETGTMENMRIINELENNLSDEVVRKVIEIKTKTMDNFKEEIRNADSQGEKVLMEKIEKFHDIKQFEMLKEMDNVIPEEKKEFWEGMKEKAQEEMQNEFHEARNQDEKNMIMKKLSGDTSEQINIIQEFVSDGAMAREMIQEQSAKIERKMENIEKRAINSPDSSSDSSNDARNELNNNNVGIANPASVYCENNGGKLKPIVDKENSYSMCIFADGSECEEWTFFRGECKTSNDSSNGSSNSDSDEIKPMIDTPDKIRSNDPVNISDSEQRSLPIEGKIKDEPELNTDSATE